MIALRAEIYSAARSAGANVAPLQVPVYYNYIRDSDGSAPSNEKTNAYADIGVAVLNQAFAGANLHFYRLGNINLLDFSPLKDEINWVSESYGYTKTALNVYVRDIRANFTAQPNQQVDFPFELNTSYVGTLTDLGPNNPYSDHAHEVGHHLGLLHTFGGPQSYIYPPLPTQIDHPEFGIFKREMAVRPNGISNGPFLPNCYIAGDLCCDTEADCTGLPGSGRTFPQFNPSGVNCAPPNVCLPGCYNGEYRDYNGDPIPKEMLNIMSYHYASNHLSPEQLQAARGNYIKYWADKYKDPLLFVRDQVEFMDGATPLKQVVIQWRHPAKLGEYSNSLSTVQGNFQGLLYENTVAAKVWKLGSGKKQNIQQNGQPYFTDAYTNQDWLEGIAACDLARINRHILGLEPMNGWQMLASDANHSNTITQFDVVEIRKLLLGAYTKLPAYDAPWRFIPEYIPAEYLSQFNTNPFAMTINGLPAPGTPYTEPTWLYQIIDGLNGKSGYDGVHLGDVEDCHNKPCTDVPTLSLTPAVLTPDQMYDIPIQSSHFSGVSAFQFGMFVDYDKLEVLDVLPGILPDFTMDAVGSTQLSDNQLKFVWFKADGGTQTLIDGSVLFTIKVQAKQPVTDINAAIHLDDAVLKNAVFKSFDCEEAVALSGGSQMLTGGNNEDRNSTLKQGNDLSALLCYPNPVSGQMTVVFENPSNDSGHLTLTDVNGRVIYSDLFDLLKGVNSLTIPVADIPNTSTGLLTVTLRTASEARTARIIKL